MSPAHLEEIRARRAALEEPWAPDECELKRDPPDEDFPRGYVHAPQGATLGDTLIQLGDTYEGHGEDWDFVAHAPQDVAALLAEVDSLRAALAVYANGRGYFWREDDTYEDDVTEVAREALGADA